MKTAPHALSYCPLCSLIPTRQEQVARNQTGRWEDGRYGLICHDCGHWQLYEKDDVEWGSFQERLQDRTNLAFWCIAVECSQPNCKSRTEWHASGSAHLHASEIADFVLKAIVEVGCNDHFLCEATVDSIEKVSQV